MLITVTIMLITVTVIATISKMIFIIKSMYLSSYFPLVSPPNNTGSSRNVLISAKGEPLTVLVTPYNQNMKYMICMQYNSEHKFKSTKKALHRSEELFFRNIRLLKQDQRSSLDCLEFQLPL